MTNQFTRRDFLKLAGILPISITAPRILNTFESLGRVQNKPQNVLVIVFDTWSSYHVSLYGYPRETMPNLAKLTERAVVYHNHYAGGNFTTPGTASLLTGVHPWTHRAFQPGGKVVESLISKNIFSAFDNFYRVSYSHNLWANLLIRQFRGDLDEYIPKRKYFLTRERRAEDQRFFLDSDSIIPTLFGNDEDLALVSWLRTFEKNETGSAYSLFLSPLYEQYRKNYYENQFADIEAFFPRGIPKDDYDIFTLEHAIDSIGNLLTTTPQPFMGYFHFWPPHAPYNTHKEFVGRFLDDDYVTTPKPLDLFGDDGPKSKHRMEYDEYILYVDREFARFYNKLESSGLLENTWVILTSDHGEMFERGIEGHRTPVLYEPVVRVPLIIFEPGRESRLDIHANTSAVDILPTLLHVTGQASLEWTEGSVLPPYRPIQTDSDRSVFIVHADKNEKYSPLKVATVAMIKGDYKIMYFIGYKELGEDRQRIELYNIKEDPEELNNLLEIELEIGNEMLDELKMKLDKMNAPYQLNS